MDKLPTCYELFGIECADGWKELLRKPLEYIEEYNKGKKDEEQIKIHQIKEKFGGLRFYVNFYDKKLGELIDEAEDKSYNTCEICGKEGKTVSYRGWIYTRCDDCMNKLKERYGDKEEKKDD